MIALLSTAYALDCAEVVNMQRAGVPEAVIAAEMNQAGTPIDLDYIGCLLGHKVRGSVVKAAARVNTTQPARPKRLSHEGSVGSASRLRLTFECGSAEILPSDDGNVRLSGQSAEQAELTVKVVGDRLTVNVGLAENEATTGDDSAELPRFDGAPRRVQPFVSPRVRLPCADLRLEVPRDLAVSLDTTRGDVRLLGLSGALDLTNDFGNVEVVGSNKDVRVRTTGGDIFTDTAADQLEIDTVSGRVVVGAGEGARALINSISGDVWVWGGPIERLTVNAVSGNIRVFSGFGEGASGNLVSHGGDIMARVPDGRVDVSSHTGHALGPKRTSAPRDDVFPASELGPALAGIWKGAPTRWWFGSGAVVSAAFDASETDFDLAARAFSGIVDVASVDRIPASSGPVIAEIMTVNQRLDDCAAKQFERASGSGHAVATLVVEPSGELASLTAPASADDSAALDDGLFSACVVGALKNLDFPPGAAARVRWPVRYGPPVVPPSPELRSQQLRALNTARD